MVTPKLQGVASSLAKLRHSLDERADGLLRRIERADGRGAAAFDAAHGQLDAAEKHIADVEAFNRELAGSNGGPPSGGSDAPSTTGAADVAHPQASWAGGKQV